MWVARIGVPCTDIGLRRWNPRQAVLRLSYWMGMVAQQHTPSTVSS